MGEFRIYKGSGDVNKSGVICQTVCDCFLATYCLYSDQVAVKTLTIGHMQLYNMRREPALET